MNNPTPPTDSDWYYLAGDATLGPHTADHIRALIASGSIPASTYVFREGMADWAKVDSLSEFSTDETGNTASASITVPPNPDRPTLTKRRMVSRWVLHFSIVLVIIAGIVTTTLVLRHQRALKAAAAERAALLVKQQKEQAASLQAARQSEEEARIAREKQVAAELEEKSKAEARARLAAENLERKDDWRIPNYDAELALHRPNNADGQYYVPLVEDARKKFSLKGERIATWFKTTELQLYTSEHGADSEIAHPWPLENYAFTKTETNHYYLLRWSSGPAGDFPRVMVYFGPESKQVEQITIDGLIDKTSEAHYQMDLAKIPHFHSDVHASLQLVTPEDTDSVENWISGFPEDGERPPDFVKFHDFENVSVAMSQITSQSTFPLKEDLTMWQVIIVPKLNPFMVDVGDWIGPPPSTTRDFTVHYRGFKSLLPSNVWNRFEMWHAYYK